MYSMASNLRSSIAATLKIVNQWPSGEDLGLRTVRLGVQICSLDH